MVWMTFFMLSADMFPVILFSEAIKTSGLVRRTVGESDNIRIKK